jgi:hypothetical protein
MGLKKKKQPERITHARVDILAKAKNPPEGN